MPLIYIIVEAIIALFNFAIASIGLKILVIYFVFRATVYLIKKLSKLGIRLWMKAKQLIGKREETKSWQ